MTPEEYKFCCELIWGGVPIDTDWAKNTHNIHFWMNHFSHQQHLTKP